jgi:hypothetical protein
MVVTALVALVATDARAQNFDVERGGFFVSANLGFGSGKFSCEQCSADRISGVTMSLALGGGLSNSVIVGGEVDAWWNSRDNTSQWISNVMAYVQVYPAPSSGFFLKGGAGYSHAEAFYPSGTSDAFASVDGFGWVIGGGYLLARHEYASSPFRSSHVCASIQPPGPVLIVGRSGGRGAIPASP